MKPETQNRRLEPTGLAKHGKTRWLTGTGPGLARQESAGRVSGRFWNRTDPYLQSKPGPLAGYPDPLLTLIVTIVLCVHWGGLHWFPGWCANWNRICRFVLPHQNSHMVRTTLLVTGSPGCMCGAIVSLDGLGPGRLVTSKSRFIHYARLEGPGFQAIHYDVNLCVDSIVGLSSTRFVLTLDSYWGVTASHYCMFHLYWHLP